ncbi:MAG: NAD(P)H-hydrate epimerase [Chloroflexi bacterium]|nr:NAD(P)H-hydrate epimerase [Chloroflexota bacterium]
MNIVNRQITVPYITVPQMVEVDRLMTEEFHIELIQMMEHAGQALAELARIEFLQGNASQKRIAVLVGTGGNAGGALVAARWLHNLGAHVHLLLAKPETDLHPVPAQQLRTFRVISESVGFIQTAGSPSSYDLIIDGLIGYSLKGNPSPPYAELIRWANSAPPSMPILALDVPSGLDATTGIPSANTIRASATLTLALPKTGFRNPDASNFVGELFLADIGVPPELYACDPLNLEVGSLFASGSIVRLNV